MPDNYRETIWAATGTTAADGLCASILPGIGATVLVTAIARHVPAIEQAAQRLADETGKTIEIVRYTRVEVLKTIRPRPQG